MPNRGAGGVSYRYGFNGKETENDVKGIGNEQDYGMRIYDPRLGRFLSVDKIIEQYPWLTPYQFGSNSPISSIDIDGLEGWMSMGQWIKKHYPVLAGVMYGTSEFLSETGRFVSKDAWKASTWKNMAKNYLAMGTMTNPNLAIAFDKQFGTDVFFRQLQIFATINEIPNWKSFDWSKNLTKLGLGILGTKGAGVVIKETGLALRQLSLVAESKSIDFRVKLLNADEVNKGFVLKGWEKPWVQGATIGEIETTTDINNLVRLSGPNNVQGQWLTTMNEIKGLTPAQIKDKLGLKYEPSVATPVTVKKGATIRVGTAARVDAFNADGGAFQIEVVSGEIKYGNSIKLK